MLSGVLLLDKPVGFSSTQALGKCKWLLGEKKAGHTGTLDPFATGLLPLVFGEATKFASFYLEGDKTYQATMRLGQRTDTGDNEGAIIASSSVAHITREAILNAAARFIGPQQQIPPMYSALKRDGKPLYELARQGIEVEREARHITIHHLGVDLINAEFDGTMDVTFTTQVSKGTYIRVLAEDMGAALGCGAHLVALRRTVTNQFTIAQATTLAALEAMPQEQRRAQLKPVEQLIEHLPRVLLEPQQAKALCNGQAVVVHGPPAKDGELVAAYFENEFLGIATRQQCELVGKRLMRT
jgi:tRNA pseudouridine55 synthase